MGSSIRVHRALFAIFLLSAFVSLLYFRTTANWKPKTTTVRIASATNFKHLKLIGQERLFASQDLDLYYASKRRVPSGPDPIHNRRAEVSREPPRRA